MSGQGFMGGSDVELWLYSTPVYLKTVVAAADGTFSTTVQIPTTTSAGSHSIVAIGVGPNEEALELAAAITVAAPSPPPTDTFGSVTRSDSSPLMPVLGLLLALMSTLFLSVTYVSQRRRR